MFQEIHRVLKPDGVLFLQLWPFYSSQHGGHAWMTNPEPFAHLRRSPFEVEQALRGRQGTDPTRAADDEFRSLNRITLNGLQRALLLAHLRVAKVAVIGDILHVPVEVGHMNRSPDLAISGVKLLAGAVLTVAELVVTHGDLPQRATKCALTVARCLNNTSGR